jgi:SAM-dependent methyltransferase
MAPKNRPEKKSKACPIETRPAVLHEALERHVTPHIQGSGRITFKCIPALIDSYLQRVLSAFRAVGRPCDPAQVEQLRAALDKHLNDGYLASPHSWVTVDYETDSPPATTLSYLIKTRVVTMQQEYREWVEVEGHKHFFGRFPDAKVMDVASALSATNTLHVLDVGAGTGRNAVALAKAGHRVSAVEMTPDLVEILRRTIDVEKVEVALIVGDVLDASTQLPGDVRLAVLCEVVSHFREPLHLQRLFRRMAAILQPGGMLLFNVFLAHPSYTPDRFAREASQAYGCSVFTRRELTDTAQQFPFELVSDESVYEYEKAHLPAQAWPPTEWFEDWTQGLGFYKLQGAKSPIEMRWMLYRKMGD